MAAAVVALFEGIIAQLTILAVFLPVVAGQGGNAGAQSLAVVMRGIDPAQSSSIILTTVTDVVGFIAFLGFAALFQKYSV